MCVLQRESCRREPTYRRAYALLDAQVYARLQTLADILVVEFGL